MGRFSRYLFEVFLELRDKWGALPVKGFRSGGQTGVDIAGAVMAYALELDAVITFPPGYLQRGIDNKDFTQTKEDVQAQIREMAAPLMR